MKVFCVAGPTACRKNELVLSLLDSRPSLAIVNVDSAQVYKELGIGANKPTFQELKSCPHYLFGHRSVLEPYDVSLYLGELKQTLERIHSLGQTPFLVGGTMMYFYQIFHGLVQTPRVCPQALGQWRKDHQSTEVEQLYQRLQDVDPILAQRVHSQDRQRIERGLSLFDLTNKRLSQLQASSPVIKSNFDFSLVKLSYENKMTHWDAIESRLDRMLNAGFVEEVKELLSLYPDNTLPFWRYVGYRQISQSLNEGSSNQIMRQRIFHATCQLAKRQKTWLKKLHGKTLFVDSKNLRKNFSEVFQL